MDCSETVRRNRRGAEGGVSPTAFILSANVHRRHLDESQRAMVGARAKPLFEAEAQARMKAGRRDPKANLPDGRQSRDDGFVEYVEKKCGIAFSTAHDYMRQAGYVPPKKRGAGRNHSETRNESDPSDAEDRDEDDCREPDESVTVQGSPASRLAQIAEAMRGSAKALFSRAEALDQLCREEQAAIASPALLTMRSMLVAAKGSIEKTLRLMGWER